MFMNTSLNGDVTTPDHHDININIANNNVHCKKTDQLNMIEIAKELVGNNKARLKHLAGFENIKSSPQFIIYKPITKI